MSIGTNQAAPGSAEPEPEPNTRNAARVRGLLWDRHWLGEATIHGRAARVRECEGGDSGADERLWAVGREGC